MGPIILGQVLFKIVHEIWKNVLLFALHFAFMCGFRTLNWIMWRKKIKLVILVQCCCREMSVNLLFLNFQCIRVMMEEHHWLLCAALIVAFSSVSSSFMRVVYWYMHTCLYSFIFLTWHDRWLYFLHAYHNRWTHSIRYINKLPITRLITHPSIIF